MWGGGGRGGRGGLRLLEIGFSAPYHEGMDGF